MLVPDAASRRGWALHGADIHDPDGGVLLMATVFGLHPFLLKFYADGGYKGPQFQAAYSGSCGSCTSAWRWQARTRESLTETKMMVATQGTAVTASYTTSKEYVMRS